MTDSECLSGHILRLDVCSVLIGCGCGQSYTTHLPSGTHRAHIHAYTTHNTRISCTHGYMCYMGCLYVVYRFMWCSTLGSRDRILVVYCTYFVDVVTPCVLRCSVPLTIQSSEKQTIQN